MDQPNYRYYIKVFYEGNLTDPLRGKHGNYYHYKFAHHKKYDEWYKTILDVIGKRNLPVRL